MFLWRVVVSSLLIVRAVRTTQTCTSSDQLPTEETATSGTAVPGTYLRLTKGLMHQSERFFFFSQNCSLQLRELTVKVAGNCSLRLLGFYRHMVEDGNYRMTLVVKSDLMESRTVTPNMTTFDLHRLQLDQCFCNNSGESPALAFSLFSESDQCQVEAATLEYPKFPYVFTFNTLPQKCQPTVPDTTPHGHTHLPWMKLTFAAINPCPGLTSVCTHGCNSRNETCGPGYPSHSCRRVTECTASDGTSLLPNITTALLCTTSTTQVTFQPATASSSNPSTTTALTTMVTTTSLTTMTPNEEPTTKSSATGAETTIKLPTVKPTNDTTTMLTNVSSQQPSSGASINGTSTHTFSPDGMTSSGDPVNFNSTATAPTQATYSEAEIQPTSHQGGAGVDDSTTLHHPTSISSNVSAVTSEQGDQVTSGMKIPGIAPDVTTYASDDVMSKSDHQFTTGDESSSTLPKTSQSSANTTTSATISENTTTTSALTSTIPGHDDVASTTAETSSFPVAIVVGCAVPSAMLFVIFVLLIRRYRGKTRRFTPQHGNSVSSTALESGLTQSSENGLDIDIPTTARCTNVYESTELGGRRASLTPSTATTTTESDLDAIMDQNDENAHILPLNAHAPGGSQRRASTATNVTLLLEINDSSDDVTDALSIDGQEKAASGGPPAPATSPDCEEDMPVSIASKTPTPVHVAKRNGRRASILPTLPLDLSEEPSLLLSPNRTTALKATHGCSSKDIGDQKELPFPHSDNSDDTYALPNDAILAPTYDLLSFATKNLGEGKKSTAQTPPTPDDSYAALQKAITKGGSSSATVESPILTPDQEMAGFTSKNASDRKKSSAQTPPIPEDSYALPKRAIAKRDTSPATTKLPTPTPEYELVDLPTKNFGERKKSTAQTPPIPEDSYALPKDAIAKRDASRTTAKSLTLTPEYELVDLPNKKFDERKKSTAQTPSIPEDCYALPKDRIPKVDVLSMTIPSAIQAPEYEMVGHPTKDFAEGKISTAQTPPTSGDIYALPQKATAKGDASSVTYASSSKQRSQSEGSLLTEHPASKPDDTNILPEDAVTEARPGTKRSSMIVGTSTTNTGQQTTAMTTRKETDGIEGSLILPELPSRAPALPAPRPSTPRSGPQPSSEGALYARAGPPTRSSAVRQSSFELDLLSVVAMLDDNVTSRAAKLADDVIPQAIMLDDDDMPQAASHAGR